MTDHQPPIGTRVSCILYNRNPSNETYTSYQTSGTVVRHVGRETVEVELKDGKLGMYSIWGITPMEALDVTETS